MIHGWVNGGDENQVKKAVNLIVALENAEIADLSKIDGKDLALAREVSKDLDSGINFQESYLRNKEKFSPITGDRVKIREEEYRYETTGIDWFGTAKDAMGGWAWINKKKG